MTEQTEQKPQKLNKQNSIQSAIYNPQEKTFFGRTSASWAKILLFYLIYYSFLALLIWLFVTQYSNRLPQPGSGGNKDEFVFPRINTRVDQPGSAVFPQALIKDKYDGENKLVLSTKVTFNEKDLSDEEFWPTDEQLGNYMYAKSMLEFRDAYVTKVKQEDGTFVENFGIDCSKNPDAVLDNPCKVSNIDQINFANIKKWIESKSPVVALALNQKIGWKPSNSKLHTELIESYPDMEFVRNAIYAQCWQTKKDNKVVGDDALFDISFLENSQPFLHPNFFPYHGNDKRSDKSIRYNKPFILVQISEKKDAATQAWSFVEQDATEISWSDFSCFFEGNNVDSPIPANEWEEKPNSVPWSKEMMKMNIGYTKFSFKYSDAKPQQSTASNSEAATAAENTEAAAEKTEAAAENTETATENTGAAAESTENKEAETPAENNSEAASESE